MRTWEGCEHREKMQRGYSLRGKKKRTMDSFLNEMDGAINDM